MLKKKIMIDFRNICDMNGFSSYLKMILKAIQVQNNIFYLLVNENAKSFQFVDYVDLNKIKLVYVKSKSFSLFSNIEIPLIISKNKIDIYHATNFNIPIFVPKSCYLISTIHDIIPIKYKQLHKRSYFVNLYLDIMFRLCTKLSNKILTVSNYSKSEIKDFLKVNENNIKVIYNCYEEKNISFNYKKNNDKKILLFVGTNFEHKNILSVVKAIKILKDQNINVFFNIAGEKKMYTGIIEKYIKKNSLENNVRIFGKVTDEELNELYKSADYYVYPSLVEGFGIPLLEAMNYGLPIISSNRTCLPEVVGEAGILIEPTPENFAASIEKLIKNPKLANDLVNLGYKQIKKFSQENFNYKLNKIYNYED